MLGKEVARGVFHGSEVASYDLLMWYASKVMETNPGSFAIVEDDGDCFRHAFFSFHKCVVGFKIGCRSLLFIYGMHFLDKYRGTLLGTTSKDTNDGFFHVAFAIINNETDAN